MSLISLVTLFHFIGLVLAVGAATVKVVLLLKTRADRAFLPVFLAAAKPITRLIIAGTAVLTLSGIGFLLLGYPFTPRLIVKIVLVAILWALGPVIDKVVEPRFNALAPAASPAFASAANRYLAIEAVATMAYYVVIGIWVTR